MKIYYLKHARLDEAMVVTDTVQVDPVVQGEADRCPLCGAFTSMLPWLSPRRAEIEIWDGYADLSFAPGGDLLVSSRFKQFYEESALSGLTHFERVEITRSIRRRGGKKVANDPPHYYHVTVARSRARIDRVASGVELSRPGPICPECCLCIRGGVVKRQRSIVLASDPPPVEDIFFARGAPGPLTSQRFYEFFYHRAITGATLIEASRYSYTYP